jgi:hypothetical protein
LIIVVHLEKDADLAKKMAALATEKYFGAENIIEENSIQNLIL